MHLNQFEVLSSDVIVVLLHFSESFLVIPHQVIDMLVLSLFDLVDFHLHPQLKLFLKVFQLLLVVLDEVLFSVFQR
jgi:hypothetical protein